MSRMNQNYPDKQLIEMLVISIPAAILSVLGFIGHMLLSTTKMPKAHQLIGGIMFSGFIGWAMCLFLLHTGMDSTLCAAVASTVGATGERGFKLLVELATKKQGG